MNYTVMVLKLIVRTTKCITFPIVLPVLFWVNGLRKLCALWNSNQSGWEDAAVIVWATLLDGGMMAAYLFGAYQLYVSWPVDPEYPYVGYWVLFSLVTFAVASAFTAWTLVEIECENPLIDIRKYINWTGEEE